MAGEAVLLVKGLEGDKSYSADTFHIWQGGSSDDLGEEVHEIGGKAGKAGIRKYIPQAF